MFRYSQSSPTHLHSYFDTKACIFMRGNSVFLFITLVKYDASKDMRQKKNRMFRIYHKQTANTFRYKINYTHKPVNLSNLILLPYTFIRHCLLILISALYGFYCMECECDHIVLGCVIVIRCAK